MTKESEKFVAYGFVNKKKTRRDAPTVTVGGLTIKIEGKTPEEKLEFIQKKKKELEAKSADLKKEFEKALQDIADHEWVEVARDQELMMDYPKSIQRFFFGIESWHNSIEPYYFWLMNYFGDIGFPVIDKITDIFTAAEHSSFYGAAGQRLGLAQDKVSQYLATIGKMVKDLFQLVRELRWIDEKLEIYLAAFGINKEGKATEKGPIAGAENALKGMWVDLVDGVVGGQRTGSNLFIMAQQLQFTALPDLFFAVNPRTAEEIDKVVDEQTKEFNIQVKNLLKRKLHQYLAWKKSTFDEMKVRRKFTLDYLRQHYHVIRMYMNWVKPYIKHIERLTGEQDLLKNPRLIAAFESSLIEIEVLARHRPMGYKKHFGCILLTFEYHTKPSMQFQGDVGYHRGPIHVGSTRMTWRSYAWSDEQVKNYLAMRNREDMELLASIDESLRSAMDALGADLMKYLQEVGEPVTIEEKPPKVPLKLLEPLTAVGKGVTELAGALIPKIGKGKPKDEEDEPISEIKKLCWQHYNIFKKANGFLAW